MITILQHVLSKVLKCSFNSHYSVQLISSEKNISLLSTVFQKSHRVRSRNPSGGLAPAPTGLTVGWETQKGRRAHSAHTTTGLRARAGCQAPGRGATADGRGGHCLCRWGPGVPRQPAAVHHLWEMYGRYFLMECRFLSKT